MTRPPFSTATLLFSVVFLAACSDGDDPAGSSGENGSDAGTSGGSTTVGRCLDPATLDYAVTPRKEDDSYLIGYSMSTDGDKVFMSGVHSVFALDVGGSAFTPIYTDASAIVPFHFLRASDVVVYDNGKRLQAVPKTGGAPTALPAFTRRPLTSLAGTADLALDGDVFYAKEVGSETTTYFRHDLASGTETDLTTEARAEQSSFKLGPDALYSYYPLSEANGAPTQPFRLAKTGGALELLTYTGVVPVHTPFAVRGSDIYLFGRDTSTGNAIVYRAAASGGAAQPLFSTLAPVVFKNQNEVFDADGGLVFRTVDSFWFLPTGASEARFVACIGGDLTLHAATATGRTIYASVVDSGNDVGGIVRIPIP